MRRLAHAGHGGPSRPRFAFLDGLRGLAALYVVIHHASLEVPDSGRHPAAVVARGLLRHGHYAVAVFIVLSGFCLMLPVARDPRGRLPGGFRAFLGRRARRIVPPYYAALALCWLLIALVPALRHESGVRWDFALPATIPRVVATHLLFVHNLDPESIFKVDPPMWSVATEWQIYLLFPALLMLWRRFGLAATITAGFALGWGLTVLAPAVGNLALQRLCPWYVGLFAMGMASAVALERRSQPLPGPARPRAALGWLVAVATALVVPILMSPPGVDFMVVDPLIGAATAGLIFRCARRRVLGTTSPVLRLLESRPAVGLGAFSYSLYLTHFPLLSLAGSMLRSQAVGPAAQLAILLLVVSPLGVLAAWLFHRTFERHFLPRVRSERDALPAPMPTTIRQS